MKIKISTQLDWRLSSSGTQWFQRLFCILRPVIRTYSLMLFLIGQFLISPATLAEVPGFEDGPQSIKGFGLYVRPEYYKWEEYDNTSGQRLLQEFGPRIRAGINTRPAHLSLSRGLMAAVFDLNGYVGRVHYNGSTMGGVALTTVSQYWGARGEVMLDSSLYAGRSRSFALLLGLEGETWSRQIFSAIAADGSMASGYTEIYKIATAKTGFKYVSIVGSGFSFEFGVKYPVFTREDIPQLGVRLEPIPLMGYFGKIEFVPAFSDRRAGVRFSVTYDLQKMDPSSLVGGYYQPAISMQLIGLQLTF